MRRRSLKEYYNESSQNNENLTLYILQFFSAKSKKYIKVFQRK